jgi:DNA replication and repair protein RecF
MFVDNLKLNNFRNFKKVSLEFNKKINVIIGKNAQGKTNIVEAIYISAFLKSFRTQKKTDLIKDGEDSLSIILNVIKDKVSNFINISIEKDNKSIRVNGKKLDDFKYINVVIFHPEEINYINSYPVYRRNLIDRSIFYTNYSYIDLYKRYFRCLKQRNIYLKENINGHDLFKDQLIKYGAEIINERVKYIDKINKIFNSDKFNKINSEEYFITYSKKYIEKGYIEESLREDFLRKKKRELSLGYTLVGPHKDDIHFYLNGKPAEGFASQGQKRSLVISYKTAQILDYKTIHSHYPVLILDDMTSELDSNRKNVLLDNLLENSGQVFITSTDFNSINNLDKTRVFKVNNGEISVAD